MDLEARDLLTVEQAAQYLQVSQSSIRSYIRQGRLQAFRIAGKRKVLIPRSALLALLEPARPEDVDAAAADCKRRGLDRQSMLEELRELWRFRYLLQMLVARELKVRYKNSVLGFAWSIVPAALSVAVINFMVRASAGRKISEAIPLTCCAVSFPGHFSQRGAGHQPVASDELRRHQKDLHAARSDSDRYRNQQLRAFFAWLGRLFRGFLRYASSLAPHLHTWILPALPFCRGWSGFRLIVISELPGNRFSLWSAALNMFYEDVKFILQTLFGLVYFVLPILYTADVIRYSRGPCGHTPGCSTSTCSIRFQRSLRPSEPRCWSRYGPRNFNQNCMGMPPVSIPRCGVFRRFSNLLFIAWSGYAYFNSRKWQFVERS